MSPDTLWKELRLAADREDYVGVSRLLDALHVALERPCADLCGRRAMKGADRCAHCYGRTREGRARMAATAAGVLATVAPVLRADEERRVVATVEADAAPELPAGDSR